jgi:hypothetical protein
VDKQQEGGLAYEAIWNGKTGMTIRRVNSEPLVYCTNFQ